MKKLFSNPIITFIIGIIIASSISVYATLTYQANQITYTKSNNQEVTLDTALTELYTASNIENYTFSSNITPSTSTQTFPTSGKRLTNNVVVDPIPSKYKDMESLSFNFANQVKSANQSNSELSISVFANYFKYFKITNITKGNNVNTCYILGWSEINSTNYNIETNTQYEVYSNTDNKKYSVLSIIAAGTNNTSGRCSATVLFYN